MGQNLGPDVGGVVFAGRPGQWKHYLGTPAAGRYDGDIRIRILWQGRGRTLRFEPEDRVADSLARALNRGFDLLRKKLESWPFVTEVLDRLVFENRSNGVGSLRMRTSGCVPTHATREVVLTDDLQAMEACIVLNRTWLDQVLDRYLKEALQADPDVQLGYLWPIVRRTIIQLGYPNHPRDRFIERIAITTWASYLSLHVLFSGKKGGRLLVSRTGEGYLQWLSLQHGIPYEDILREDQYLRRLCELRFLYEKPLATDPEGLEIARVIMREYLDERYLRPSVAGIMPSTPEENAAMPYTCRKDRIMKPSPRIHHYGVHDKDDLSAWKKVDRKLRDAGFHLLRQLGMGDYGRVYEALNTGNPRLPETVAIKVDRIYRRKENQAIQAAETTLQLSNALAPSPHLIRIFDAGIIPGTPYTFHVLQLIEGDTLDSLFGVSGHEHPSIERPDTKGTSLQKLREVYLASLEGRSRSSEFWRSQRAGLPFVDVLNLRQLMDIVISMLLLIEKVHAIGYAINDLKNGNFMINQNGQLKGIDLDTFSPIRSSTDKFADFIFLSISLLLLMNSRWVSRNPVDHFDNDLQQNPATLNQFLLQALALEDIREKSSWKLNPEDVSGVFADLILRSKNETYLRNPQEFQQDIDRLILFKRQIHEREIVLD